MSQVWVELVGSGGVASAGQLSGCVSAEQASFPGHLANITVATTEMPRLAGERELECEV